MLEILQVAKKFASNLWKALGKRGREKGKGEGWGGGGGRLLNKASFGEASPLRPKVQYLTLKYTIFDKRYPFRVSPLKSCTLFIYLLHENKSLRKEVFRSFSSNLKM